ncbi:MAG: carbohydrate kinase family protein [Candidatus Saccharimonadales bacterium]
MAKALQDLLSNNHPLFTTTIHQLEQASGSSNIDVRLIADITHAAHNVMRQLGLDTADTTSVELYKALTATAVSGQAENLLINTSYVLINLGDGPISFNIQDVIDNHHHELDFEHRVSTHGQLHLRSEIVKRYADSDRSDNKIITALAAEIGLHYMNPTDTDHTENSINKTPHILAIGDIFTDAFITLGDDTAKIFKEGDTEWLAVPFGRKPPYERVDIVKSVGPSPNVAVSIARLGYSAGLMAWIGGDATGEEAIDHLKAEHVATDSMIVESDKATSYWYVLCYKADRTMLVKSEKYRYEWRDPATAPDWIYLAYLGEDSWPLHEGLLDYLERNPSVNFALQPGTFQFEWGLEKMRSFYKRSRIVLMNREEAMDVTGLPHDSVRNLANGLHDLGPEIVVITDGPNGSFVSQNGRLLTIPNYPDPVPPVERTGAGDAFSSTFVAAVAAGESVETALSWAPINSMNVVQHVGAQAGLLTKEKLLEYLQNAPEDYRVTEVQE